MCNPSSQRVQFDCFWLFLNITINASHYHNVWPIAHTTVTKCHKMISFANNPACVSSTRAFEMESAAVMAAAPAAPRSSGGGGGCRRFNQIISQNYIIELNIKKNLLLYIHKYCCNAKIVNRIHEKSTWK